MSTPAINIVSRLGLIIFVPLLSLVIDNSNHTYGHIELLCFTISMNISNNTYKHPLISSC